MKREYRIVSLVMYLIMASVNGFLYLLINASTPKEIIKYSVLNLIAIIIAFGVGFLFQKMGVKFKPKEKEEA